MSGAQSAIVLDELTSQEWVTMGRDRKDIFTEEFSRGRDYEGIDPNVETLVKAKYDIKDILGIN